MDDHARLLEGGLGYRARIGFLSPGLVDEALSAQFYRMAPAGVTMVRTSLELRDVTVGEVQSAVSRAEAAARELAKFKPDCIALGGSPTVAVGGFGSDAALVGAIEGTSGIRAYAAQAAAIEALREFRVRRLAVVAPFPDDVNALVRDFLEKSGFEILRYEPLRVKWTDLFSTPLRESYELGKRTFRDAGDAEGLYFPCAPQPVVDNIEPLERELGTTVVASMQATLWKGLKLTGVKTPIEGYGKLLRAL